MGGTSAVRFGVLSCLVWVGLHERISNCPISRPRDPRAFLFGEPGRTLSLGAANKKTRLRLELGTGTIQHNGGSWSCGSY